MYTSIKAFTGTYATARMHGKQGLTEFLTWGFNPGLVENITE